MTKSPSSRRTARDSITPQERLALIGLVALGQHHNRQMRAIEEAALEITQDIDGQGNRVEVWSSAPIADAFYELDGRPGAAVDRVLRNLDLKVKKPAKRPAKGKKGKR